MKLSLFVTAALLSTVILISCNKDNPVPPGEQPQINLTLEDVSCTEAWLKLTTANISLPADIELLKNEIHLKTISLTSADTLLYIDALLPNKSYNFTSIIHTADGSIKSSAPATTMDTTSHDFTWHSWTFGGDAGGCELYDVAIIDQNDIWAVGDIDIADTSINGFTTYNAVHWDGVEWELKRVQTIFRGNLITVPLTGIFAFSSTDIWMVGSLPIHGDGQNWVIYDLRTTVDPNLSLSKAWGEDTDDMYFVGNSGSLAHKKNGQWTRIESGTDANITDIWGIPSSGSNEGKIYCSVPSGLESSKRRILKINEDNSVDSIPCNGNIVSSSWSPSGGIIYTSGGGIYTNKSGSWEKEIVFPDYYTYRVRGNGLTDIFVCGNYGFLGHYNGKKWKVYPEFIQQSYIHFLSVNLKDDIIAIVGVSGESALIILGERN